MKPALAALPATEQRRYDKIIRMVRELHPGVEEEKAGLVTYRGFKTRTDGVAKLRRVKEASLSVRPTTGQTWHAAKSSIFTALDASVITMLHELTHIESLTDTDDELPIPYDIAFCQKLARKYPDRALNNAENYAQFAKAALLKLQFAPPRAVRI
ncbi:MAG: M35 family metallo-endopeptidase [Gemmatimonadota bacterium]